MAESEWLAKQFEGQRGHLRAVAYRMLGSLAEADDAVQDAWLRASRADGAPIENMRGWLTTIVARVSLNMLRSRRTHQEESLDAHLPDFVVSGEAANQPEEEALLADSVGLALLVVLDTLAPAERLAFVLHDVFKLPFEEIAPMVDRTPAAARQLASRARWRLRRPHGPAGSQRGVARRLRQAPRAGPRSHTRPVRRRSACADRRALAEREADPSPHQRLCRRGHNHWRAALLDDGFHHRGRQDRRDRRHPRPAAHRKARRRRTSLDERVTQSTPGQWSGARDLNPGPHGPESR